jgi:hypothetical protein
MQRQVDEQCPRRGSLELCDELSILADLKSTKESDFQSSHQRIHVCDVLVTVFGYDVDVAFDKKGKTSNPINMAAKYRKKTIGTFDGGYISRNKKMMAHKRENTAATMRRTFETLLAKSKEKGHKIIRYRIGKITLRAIVWTMFPGPGALV